MNKFSKKTLIILFSILLLLYLAGIIYFSEKTFPNTYVNNEEKSLMKTSDIFVVKDNNFKIDINGRDNKNLNISTSDIDYNSEIDGKPEIKQNIFMWPIELFKRHDYSYKINTSYSDNKLIDIIENSEFFKNVIEPEDAKIVEEENNIYIKEEVNGNKLDEDKFIQLVRDAIDSRILSVNLEDDVYINPEITSENQELKEKFEKINDIFSRTYTFDFEDRKYELTGKELLDMFSDDEAEYKLNEESVKAYIKDLANKTNTYAKPRKFNATGIGEVTVPAGIYGWRMDVVDTTQNLVDMINNDKTGEVDIVYIQEAKHRGLDDIGDTYVEIDLSRQHMWFYKDGKLVTDTDIVSGDLRADKKSGVSLGSTPVGTGLAWAKIRDKDLKGFNAVTGEEYIYPTKYFIPFTYTDAGLHDNNTRSVFGGEIYKKNGSSSCVNTPPDVMKIIFENLPIYSAVVVYESSTNYSPTDFERYEQLRKLDKL